ncbi:MAG: UDP-3-O-(3-hydroxymyristoyl)glucosamine N-acyltransferase [Chitinispirillaceae bacterium]|nr:UDP-3-O-(3-hydroxymyristoyl)glucosamine N-acyltransferase [Chitinispirillaceae bacterium]
MRLSTIARLLGISLPGGATDAEIDALRSPEQAGERDMVFLAGPKFSAAVEASRAGFVIVKHGQRCGGKICLEVDDPYVAYARVAQLFEDRSPVFGNGIAPTAFIDPSAAIAATASVGPGSVIGARVTIGENCRVGARCVIEKGCTMGADCRIDSGAVIRHGTAIGNRVVIQSGAIVGSDGFGNAREKDVFIRIPAFGNVVVGDDAEIGANTTIDRGNFASTIIGKGVKLDNLIHVAHNVTIDEHSAMAAQTGISGSTRFGKRVIVGGQAGFVGHIDIGDDAFIGAKAGVSKSIGPGAKITGYPARDLMTMRRIEAAEQQLPQLIKDIKALKKQVDALRHDLSSQRQ